MHQTGNIAFHIRQKYRYAQFAEGFRHHLQRHRLSCTGCSCNQPVTICHLGKHHNMFLLLVDPNPDLSIFQHVCLPYLVDDVIFKMIGFPRDIASILS